jgi:hypothetical protein
MTLWVERVGRQARATKRPLQEAVLGLVGRSASVARHAARLERPTSARCCLGDTVPEYSAPAIQHVHLLYRDLAALSTLSGAPSGKSPE